MRKSKDIKGNKNKIVGRDDNSKTILNFIREKRIENIIEEFMKEADDKMNSAYKDGFLSPISSKKEKFESSKLLTSLASMNVPILISFVILKYIIANCESKSKENNNKPVTTNAITELVEEALKNERFQGYKLAEIEKILIRYLRQYGNSNRSIKIWERDFTESELNYEYLKTKLIPHILTRSLNINFFDRKGILYSSQDFEEIAEEIMAKIQYLNIYAIDYRTLLGLATNLAIQPPHPWISTVETKRNNVIYHSDLAYKFFGQLDRFKLERLEDNDIIELNRIVVECVDHSCSSLLHHYSLFLGAGKLRPLNHLIKFLDLRKKGIGNIKLWERCSINNIESDLGIMNHSIEYLEETLHLIRQGIPSSYNEKKIPELIRLTKLLYITIADITQQNSEIQELFLKIDQSSSSGLFLKIVEKVFISINGFKNININPISGTFNFQQFQKSSPLSNRKNIIQGIVSQFKGLISLLELKKLISDSEIEQNKRICNCLFIITQASYTKECIKYIKENFWEHTNLYILSISELQKVFDSTDRNSKFIEVLLSFEQKLIN